METLYSPEAGRQPIVERVPVLEIIDGKLSVHTHGLALAESIAERDGRTLQISLVAQDGTQERLSSAHPWTHLVVKQ